MSWDSTLSSLSPIGWWKLNTSSGSVATDSGSGANNGTIHGGVTLGVAGPIATNTAETAITFSGSTGQYVSIPQASDLEFGTTSFSFGLWVNFTTSNAVGNTLMEKGNVNSAQIGWKLVIGSSNNITASLSDDTHNPQAIATGPFNDSKWHFVVAVNDKPNTLLWIYVDGVPLASTATTSLGSLSNASFGINFVVGSALAGPYQGSLAQGFVVGSVLTATRIAALYESAKSAGQLLQFF